MSLFSKIILMTLFLFCITIGNAWFTLDGISLHRLYITRVNEYETMSLHGTNFDLGDISPLIVSNYGGGMISPTNAFVCSWPITIEVYFVPRTNDGGGPYVSALLEYHSGTNATSDTNWITFAEIKSNQFQAAEGNVGAHFGIVTWVPPDVSNALYLVRIWAQIETGPGSISADRTVTNITCNGDGFTWTDETIVGIKVIPHKRPGY
jgi:hypothetical protein